MGIKIGIDLLLYINLDYREDRRIHMEHQLVECPWPVERLSATRLEVSPEEAGINMHPTLTGKRGVASIWLSHKKALTKFLLNAKTDAFVLLEDDVVIFNEFWSHNSDLLSGLSADWEIVLLTPKYRYRKKIEIPESEVGKKYARPPNGRKPVFLPNAAKKYIITGAHFCIFRNSDVVKKVLKRMELTEEIYDVDKFYVLNFNSYGVQANHISSGGFGSDHGG